MQKKSRISCIVVSTGKKAKFKMKKEKCSFNNRKYQMENQKRKKKENLNG